MTETDLFNCGVLLCPNSIPESPHLAGSEEKVEAVLCPLLVSRIVVEVRSLIDYEIRKFLAVDTPITSAAVFGQTEITFTSTRVFQQS